MQLIAFRWYGGRNKWEIFVLKMYDCILSRGYGVCGVSGLGGGVSGVVSEWSEWVEWGVEWEGEWVEGDWGVEWVDWEGEWVEWEGEGECVEGVEWEGGVYGVGGGVSRVGGGVCGVGGGVCGVGGVVSGVRGWVGGVVYGVKGGISGVSGVRGGVWSEWSERWSEWSEGWSEWIERWSVWSERGSVWSDGWVEYNIILKKILLIVSLKTLLMFTLFTFSASYQPLSGYDAINLKILKFTRKTAAKVIKLGDFPPNRLKYRCPHNIYHPLPSVSFGRAQSNLKFECKETPNCSASVVLATLWPNLSI